MSVHSNVGPSGQLVEYAQGRGVTHDLFQDQFLCCLIQHSVQNNFLKSPHSHSSVFIAPLSLARIEYQPSLFCCSKLWLATLNGREPKSAVQLSEAVVGGRVPRRLVQQTVCGVFD